MEDDDPVVAALSTLAARLDRAGIGSELANGNVESELKLFLASALRVATRPYVCVMDKEFNRAPLDLLALENGTPAFWLEMKCTLRSAGAKSIHEVVIDALAQVQHYSDRLQEVNWREARKWPYLTTEIDAFKRAITAPRCSAYIVHILNSGPGDAGDLPELITRKFPTQPAMNAQQLQRLYVPGGDLCPVLHERQEGIQKRLQNIPDEQIREAKELRLADRRLRWAVRAYRRLEASCVCGVLQSPLTEAVVVRFKPAIESADLGPGIAA